MSKTASRIAVAIILIISAACLRDVWELWTKLHSPPPVQVYTAGSLPAKASSIRQTAVLDLQGIWYSRGYRDQERDGDWVHQVAASQDGKMALVSGGDTLRLWDVGAQKLLYTLSVHFENLAYRVLVQNTIGGASLPVISPDNTLAAADFNSTGFKIWDLRTGQEKLHIRGHRSNVSDLVFSRDGKKIYSASFDRTVKIWDTETGRLLKTFAGFEDWVERISISPNEDMLFILMRKSSVIRNIKTGDDIEQLGEIQDTSIIRDISPDWRFVLTDDEAPQIWDVESGRMLYLSPPKAILNPDWTLAAVRDRRYKRCETVTLVDLKTQKQIDEIELRGFLSGFFRSISSVSFSPDGKSLYIGTLEGEVLLYTFSRRPLPAAGANGPAAPADSTARSG